MLVSADGWGWRYAGRTSWAARGVDLHIEAGERVLLLGPSGAGKSTLLLALAGVLGSADEGTEAGHLLIDGRHPTRRVGKTGLVRQDPASQIVLATVGDDVAFGCENLGVPPDRIWPRVRDALAQVGLSVPLDRQTNALSGGQQQRLVLAGALAMQPGPDLLLLDEPTANLDPAGLIEVRDAVAATVADRRVTLILVEHRIEAWLGLIDRVIMLGAGGGVLADGDPERVFAERGAELADAGVWAPGIPLPADVDPRPVDDQADDPADDHWALRTHDLTVGYATGHPARDHLDVIIPRGASTVIVGRNGVGKSALALTLAGLLPPLAGAVEAASRLCPAPATRKQRRLCRTDADRLTSPDTWTSRQMLTRLGTVFQQPEHQFVTGSVRDELAVGLGALRWQHDAIQARVDELLDLLHLDDVASVNPFALSGGQQRRLSVGTVLATRPAVVIMDEPTFGQDRITWLDMVRLVRRLVDDGGTVISVTHDPEYRRILGEHVIDLDARP